MYDLIIKGGRVIDPAQNIDGVMDVAISGGKIDKVAANIPVKEARKTFDAAGKIVTPGLIDIHTHVYDGVLDIGANPDDAGVKFNEAFLLSAPNRLVDLLPEFAHLADALRVVDVPEAAGGKVLRILMNADREKAVAMLADPGAGMRAVFEQAAAGFREDGDHARWRLRMAEQIAFHCDAERWGVRAIYIFGEPKSGAGSPGSPIKLAVHIQGTPQQRRELEIWFQGWSLALAEMNYLRTGFHSEGLLDVHIVSGDDVKGMSSVAAKVNAPPDSIKELPLGNKPSS